MKGVVLQPAGTGDIQDLFILEVELFPWDSDRISPRQFKYLLTRANCSIIKAACGSCLLGFIVLLGRKNSRAMRIYSLGVSPGARRQGVARSLLRYAESLALDNGCDALSLEVCENNSAALGLYLSCHFQWKGRKKPDYYSDGCCALVLKKHLQSKERKHDSPGYANPVHQPAKGTGAHCTQTAAQGYHHLDAGPPGQGDQPGING